MQVMYHVNRSKTLSETSRRLRIPPGSIDLLRFVQSECLRRRVSDDPAISQPPEQLCRGQRPLPALPAGSLTYVRTMVLPVRSISLSQERLIGCGRDTAWGQLMPCPHDLLSIVCQSFFIASRPGTTVRFALLPALTSCIPWDPFARLPRQQRNLYRYPARSAQ